MFSDFEEDLLSDHSLSNLQKHVSSVGMPAFEPPPIDDDIPPPPTSSKSSAPINLSSYQQPPSATMASNEMGTLNVVERKGGWPGDEIPERYKYVGVCFLIVIIAILAACIVLFAVTLSQTYTIEKDIGRLKINVPGVF